MGTTSEPKRAGLKATAARVTEAIEDLADGIDRSRGPSLSASDRSALKKVRDLLGRVYEEIDAVLREHDRATRKQRPRPSPAAMEGDASDSDDWSADSIGGGIGGGIGDGDDDI